MKHEGFDDSTAVPAAMPGVRTVRKTIPSAFGGETVRWFMEDPRYLGGAKVPLSPANEDSAKLNDLRRSLVEVSGNPKVDPSEAIPKEEFAARATVGIGTAIAGVLYPPAGAALLTVNTLGKPNLKLTAQVIALSGTFLGIASF